jgi:hypothetical protein
MEHSFVHIYTGSPVVVLALRNALQAENIIPVIKDESESARMAGFGITHDQQKVFVHQDELQKAEKVLSTLELLK